ncbi:MAG: diguanylate cyclase [Nitrospirota bacterium]|nr:MAG: diguanylate cyclase [Nitrospirota bacterium]
MRILLVNEEDYVRNAISHILMYDGHEVTEASSGREAFDLFFSAPFPLIIADLNLADMDGLELTRKIKDISQESEVIIITSSSSIDSAVEAMRSGAYDYLIKNFEDFELINDKVKRAAEKIRLNRENRELMEKLKQAHKGLQEEFRSLSTLAMRDSESGLYNSEYFQERLLIELKRSKRHNHKFSLLFIDLEPFIRYSEEHKGERNGIGDVGKCFKETLRRTDVIIRYSDDKMVVLLPETPKDGAYTVVEKLRKAEEESPCFGDEQYSMSRVTINIGVSTYPEDGEEGTDLLRSAIAVL